MVKMPSQTQAAVNWALEQEGVVVVDELGFREIYPNGLVDKVREYFNHHGIECSPMCYDDLIPFLPQ